MRFLDDQIYRYNVARTGIDDGRLLAIIVRDETGIAAGLHGFTWGRVMEVKSFWVREDLRGRGYGTQLLAAAEQEAMQRGCLQVVLDTHSFQAPEFYRRQGYEVYGILTGYPPGHSKYFMKKALRPDAR